MNLRDEIRRQITAEILELSHDDVETHRISPCAAKSMLRELISYERTTEHDRFVMTRTLEGRFHELTEMDITASAATGVSWLCKQAIMQGECFELVTDESLILRRMLLRGLVWRSRSSFATLALRSTFSTTTSAPAAFTIQT